MAKISFLKVPRPCERAEWATNTCWESREGFSPSGEGLGEWAERAESEALTRDPRGKE